MSNKNIVFTTRSTTTFKTKEQRQESVDNFLGSIGNDKVESVDILARVTHSDGRVDLHHLYTDQNHSIHTLQGHKDPALQGVGDVLNQVIGMIEHPLVQTNHESFFKIKDAPALEMKDVKKIDF